MGEIAENCAGVKLVLVALKCDLREKHSDDDDEEEELSNGNVGTEGTTTRKQGGAGKDCIDYKQGLEVARRIQALRYLGMCGAVLRFCLVSSLPLFFITSTGSSQQKGRREW